MRRIWSIILAFLLIGLLVGVLVLKYNYNLEYNAISVQRSVVEKTYINYKKDVLVASKNYDLPPAYLLSLIVLESSGRKIIPQRYENHIYKKLDAVARSKQKALEGITAEDLSGMTDGQLKKLASSWGPFQIMGYKCFEIEVDVEDLQGKNAVMNGAKWVEGNYGVQLRKGHFKDAFHIHNTGRPYPAIGPPKTYHKSYVPKGLKYMEEFEALLKNE
ncbi:MAG: hypothetical protein ACI9JN_000684 [Bacteroidia bacterium]|jgi:hypothetical protein